jgi:carboxyl-terminal processing protease
LRVAGIIAGGPADRDGRLRWGDHIIAVAQESDSPVDVTNMPLRRAVNLIRGPRGTKVYLTIIPVNAGPRNPPSEIALIRDVIDLRNQEARLKTIPLPPVKSAANKEATSTASLPKNLDDTDQENKIDFERDDTHKTLTDDLNAKSQPDDPPGEEHISHDVVGHLDDMGANSTAADTPQNSPILPSNRHIGIVSLQSFYRESNEQDALTAPEKSAARDVLREIKQAIKRHSAGLIVDLRFNGGGNLEDAIDMAGLFIPLGPIVQVRDIYGRIHIKTDADGAVAYAGPLVVLVNRYSASASEIFAAAMQDYHRAVIVGESTTFGKGTMQSLKHLERNKVSPDFDPGALKLTSGKIYRVNGSSTQRKGISPDIVFASTHDRLTMGEQQLPNALFWDAIDPLNVRSDWDAGPDLLTLRYRSRLRLEHHAEWLSAIRDAETITDKNEWAPLNIAKRRIYEQKKKEAADKLASCRRYEQDWQLQEAIDVLKDLIELEALK